MPTEMYWMAAHEGHKQGLWTTLTQTKTWPTGSSGCTAGHRWNHKKRGRVLTSNPHHNSSNTHTHTEEICRHPHHLHCQLSEQAGPWWAPPPRSTDWESIWRAVHGLWQLTPPPWRALQTAERKEMEGCLSQLEAVTMHTQRDGAESWEVVKWMNYNMANCMWLFFMCLKRHFKR